MTKTKSEIRLLALPEPLRGSSVQRQRVTQTPSPSPGAAIPAGRAGAEAATPPVPPSGRDPARFPPSAPPPAAPGRPGPRPPTASRAQSGPESGVADSRIAFIDKTRGRFWGAPRARGEQPAPPTTEINLQAPQLLPQPLRPLSPPSQALSHRRPARVPRVGGGAARRRGGTPPGVGPRCGGGRGPALPCPAPGEWRRGLARHRRRCERRSGLTEEEGREGEPP